MTSWQWFERGGPVVWPLLVLWCVAVAIAIDRSVLLALTRTGWTAARLAVRLMADNEASNTTYLNERSVVVRIARTQLALLLNAKRGRRAVLARVGEELVAMLEKRVGVLTTIATIAPLLGLLGTVLGMMEAFRSLEQNGGAADIGVLAGGLWPALLTTALGLVVALFAFVLQALLRSVINSRIEAMRTVVALLEENYAKVTPGDALPALRKEALHVLK